jgi:hypothetical protein
MRRGVGDGPRVAPHGCEAGGGGHEEGAARRGMADSGPAVAFADGVRPAPK